MEAKDLMVGDWVYVSHGGKAPHNGKVTSLLSSGAVDVELLDGESALCSSVKPIPITPEILEKNGFIRKHPESEKRAYWVLRVAGGNVKVKRNWGYFYFEVTGTPLEMGMFLPHFEAHLAFVHELQHALRLCEIDKNIEL